MSNEFLSQTIANKNTSSKIIKTILLQNMVAICAIFTDLKSPPMTIICLCDHAFKGKRCHTAHGITGWTSKFHSCFSVTLSIYKYKTGTLLLFFLPNGFFKATSTCNYVYYKYQILLNNFLMFQAFEGRFMHVICKLDVIPKIRTMLFSHLILTLMQMLGTVFQSLHIQLVR